MTKTTPADLAIFGGAPSFVEPLHVGRPNVGDRGNLFARIGNILDSGWLTNNGPQVRELEARVASIAGSKHAVATCNATIGLEIAARAIGMTGSVLVPAFTFVASSHALQWQHITPIFCDVDPLTHNIDIVDAEGRMRPDTTGILGVHVWGRPCNVDAIDSLARRNGIGVLYDAAHAFGCSAGGRPIGMFGDATVFSFHATKFLNSFEGGAIVTDDDDLAARARSMTNFGITGPDLVTLPGTNGKMTEICAAMGLTSLESMGKFVDANRRNYELYCSLLETIQGVSVLRYARADDPNYQYVVIEIDGTAGMDRDTLQGVLLAENVLSRRYFYPGCHTMPAYNPANGDPVSLPNTDFLTRRVLSLPNGTSISEEAVRTVCSLIRLCMENGDDITERRSDDAR